jgi:hypothetical protein
MSDYKTTKQLCADIRAALKKEIPGCKFSVVGENYSMGRSINVALMEGPFEALWANPKNEYINKDGKQYLQVNHYYLDRKTDTDVITDECREVLLKAKAIGLKDHWDESDVQTDYFHCNFYFHLNIGKWDKPFINTKGG